MWLKRRERGGGAEDRDQIDVRGFEGFLPTDRAHDDAANIFRLQATACQELVAARPDIGQQFGAVLTGLLQHGPGTTVDVRLDGGIAHSWEVPSGSRRSTLHNSLTGGSGGR